MKTKATIFTLIFTMIFSIGFSQKNEKSMKLITGKVSITKYHTLEQLNNLPKGDLLTLYIDRIEVIVNMLPNIAFATKPNVTMFTLGIPETRENKKALQANRLASVQYFDSTVLFQKLVLPYSDSRDLIAAILFYEDTLKSLHTYNDFKAN